VAEGGFDAVAIFRALNRHSVEYVVVGGFAVAAWGVIRATEDLDLVVEPSWDNFGERIACSTPSTGRSTSSITSARFPPTTS
jgi:hypothetical protein